MKWKGKKKKNEHKNHIILILIKWINICPCLFARRKGRGREREMTQKGTTETSEWPASLTSFVVCSVFLFCSPPHHPSSPMAPTYSLEEVSKHTKTGDVWIAIRGKVYNVSEFMSDHPGGEEVIRDVAGQSSIPNLLYFLPVLYCCIFLYWM